jgi:hypothetical protein
MSPTPLIELQRRLSLVGAIRAGGQKPERGVGRKLEAWRITSPRQQLIEQAAELYGGEVSEWASPVGREWQVYTSVDELPVLLMPSYSLRQSYELWEGATKRTRLCDGVDEELSGGPCLCNQEGVDRCDLYTRLVCALPELDTLLGWRVITRGANAAHELPTMIDAARASGATFVPARLRLEQRRGVVDGQVTRFVVPTLDLGVGYAALAAAQTPALPVATGPSITERALDAAVDADRPAPLRGGRQAAAFGPESISPEEARAHEPPDNDGETRQQTLKPSDAMISKLNVLVGKLREQGSITTDGLYDAIAQRLRGTAGLDLAATTPDWTDRHGNTHKALDDDGTTHWAPLRETLTRVEAHQLIEWLTKVEARGSAGETAGDEPAAPETRSQEVEQQHDDDEPQHVTVPFNEFPEGF